MARYNFGVSDEGFSKSLALFLRDERMARFQKMLVEKGGSTPQDAANLCESMISAVFEGWGRNYVKGASRNVREIVRIRGELEGRYRSIMDTFSPGRPLAKSLPPELNPESFRVAFDRLNRLMDGIEYPEDYIHETEALEYSKKLETAIEEEPPEPQPDENILNRIPGEEPESFRKGKPEEIPRRTEKFKAGIREKGEEIIAKHMPGSRIKKLVPEGKWNAAAIAEYERLRVVDPVFAGNGIQLEIELPNGESFRPDAIGIENGRIRFYDNKQVLSINPEESMHFDPEVQQGLRSQMEKYASIAKGATDCDGVTFTTNSEDVAVLMRSIKQEIARKVGGKDLASLISVEGPGGGQ
jgi:hypothetical protein